MTHVDPALVRAIAPTGVLRAALNLGNPVLVQKNPATGAVGGVTVDLATELARRLGIELAFVQYDTAGKVVEALRTGVWDIGFLAIDPLRAEEIAFTAAYVQIEGAYLVREAAPLRTIGEVDQPGVRIAVGKGAAYDLHLSRTLKNAELVRFASSGEAIEAFLRGETDACGGIRQPLTAQTRKHSGFRVIEQSFMHINQAMCVPKGRDAAFRYVRAFVEEMKASGFISDALARSGRGEANVAPPATL